MILKSEKIVFIIKVLNLLIGFPNNNYPPYNKNYLRCLLLREGGTFRGKGLATRTKPTYPYRIGAPNKIGAPGHQIQAP